MFTNLPQLLGRHYKWLYIVDFYRRRELTYIANNILWSISLMCHLGSIIFVYFFANPSIFGEVIEYMFWTHVIFLITNSWVTLELSARIFEGKITSNLIVPTNLYWKNFWTFVGKSLCAYAIISLPALFVFWLFAKSYLISTITIQSIIMCIPLLILGYWLYFSIGYISASVTFWVLRPDAVNDFFYVIRNLFRGDLIQLSRLASIYPLVIWQPFAFVGYHTYNTLLNKYSTQDYLIFLCGSIFWAIILFLLARIIFKMGLKKNEAVGL